MNGKGSKQRPRQVGRDEYARRWDAVFAAGKKAHPELQLFGVPGHDDTSRLTGTFYDGSK